MTGVTLPPLGNPSFADVVTRPLLEPTECAALLGLLRDDGWEGTAVTTERPGERLYDPAVRSATSQDVPLDERWPWARLRDAIAEVNAEVHRFRLWGIPDDDRPTVVRYEADGQDHFRPHTDVGRTLPTRKLTFTVQLSDPADYRGGDLVLTQTGTRAPRDQGTLVVFPSFATHVVSPVVRGVRYALVGWVHGPTFA